MKLRSTSSSSCKMFARATTIKWCMQLVVYWTLKHVTSVAKEFIEFLGRRVYDRGRTQIK